MPKTKLTWPELRRIAQERGIPMPTTRKALARDLKWAELHKKADEAGHAASRAHNPEPFGLTDGKRLYVLDGGPCGFAWVTIRPANCSFALWLKRQEGDRVYKAYHGGLQRFAPLLTQSMTTKEAYCRAYAKVLQEAGINANAGSRLD